MSQRLKEILNLMWHAGFVLVMILSEITAFYPLSVAVGIKMVTSMKTHQFLPIIF